MVYLSQAGEIRVLRTDAAVLRLLHTSCMLIMSSRDMTLPCPIEWPQIQASLHLNAVCCPAEGHGAWHRDVYKQGDRRLAEYSGEQDDDEAEYEVERIVHQKTVDDEVWLRIKWRVSAPAGLPGSLVWQAAHESTS